MHMLRVPANVLIAGEYTITEPGGLGIALALDRHVEMTVERASSFEFVGWFGKDERVELNRPIREDNLPGLIVSYCARKLGVSTVDLEGKIHIDSRAFYDEAGYKLGYGSSASVAVALCAGLAILTGRTKQEADSFAAGTAVEAHRYAQNGRGSGYDISMASALWT